MVSSYPINSTKNGEMGLFRQCFKAEVKLLTENNYPDLHHSQGVWNLPHKFHLYLILIFYFSLLRFEPTTLPSWTCRPALRRRWPQLWWSTATVRAGTAPSRSRPWRPSSWCCVRQGWRTSSRTSSGSLRMERAQLSDWLSKRFVDLKSNSALESSESHNISKCNFSSK